MPKSTLVETLTVSLFLAMIIIISPHVSATPTTIQQKLKDVPLSSASTNSEVQGGSELPSEEQVTVPAFIYTALRGLLFAFPLMAVAL